MIEYVENAKESLKTTRNEKFRYKSNKTYIRLIYWKLQAAD